MSQKGDVKESVVKKQTEEMTKAGLSHEKAQKIARESAERVNRERREKR